MGTVAQTEQNCDCQSSVQDDDSHDQQAQPYLSQKYSQSISESEWETRGLEVITHASFYVLFFHSFKTVFSILWCLRRYPLENMLQERRINSRWALVEEVQFFRIWGTSVWIGCLTASLNCVLHVLTSHSFPASHSPRDSCHLIMSSEEVQNTTICDVLNHTKSEVFIWLE